MVSKGHRKRLNQARSLKEEPLSANSSRLSITRHGHALTIRSRCWPPPSSVTRWSVIHQWDVPGHLGSTKLVLPTQWVATTGCSRCHPLPPRRSRCAVGKGSRARKRQVFPRCDRVQIQAHVRVLPGEHQSLRQASCGAGGAAPSHRRVGRGRRAGQGAPSRRAPDLRAPDVPRHHNNHFYYLLHGRHGPSQHFNRALRLHCSACPHCGACSSTSTRLRSVAVCRMAEALEHLRHGR